MSELFPHTAYAEDQPFPYPTLTTHVLSRGFQSGAPLSTIYGVGRSLCLKCGGSGLLLSGVSLLRSALLRWRWRYDWRRVHGSGTDDAYVDQRAGRMA